MADSSPKAALSRLSIEIVVGAVVGFIGSTVGGPGLISLWYEPPSKDAFSCAGTVREALHQFVMMQFFCAVLGGVALATFMFFAKRFFRRRTEAKSGSTG